MQPHKKKFNVTCITAALRHPRAHSLPPPPILRHRPYLAVSCLYILSPTPGRRQTNLPCGVPLPYRPSISSTPRLHPAPPCSRLSTQSLTLPCAPPPPPIHGDSSPPNAHKQHPTPIIQHPTHHHAPPFPRCGHRYVRDRFWYCIVVVSYSLINNRCFSLIIHLQRQPPIAHTSVSLSSRITHVIISFTVSRKISSDSSSRLEYARCGPKLTISHQPGRSPFSMPITLHGRANHSPNNRSKCSAP